jgi:hypothetical protein
MTEPTARYSQRGLDEFATRAREAYETFSQAVDELAEALA